MWLTIRSGSDRGKAVEIGRARFVIGRDEECDLVLDDEKVSRRHATLEGLTEGAASLSDLGSANGTFVNGNRVSTATLQGNEQVQVGDTVLATTREKPGDDGASATVLGASPRRSQSAVYRLALKRSRTATYLGAAALAVALVAGALFATGVLPPGDDGAPDAVQRVVREAAPSTVLITGERRGRGAGSGSGWVLDADAGLLVTNAHVVDGARDFQVGLSGRIRKGSVVGLAPCEDLAVLRVKDRSGLRTMPLGSQSSLEQGETVVAVGYPRNASLEASLASTAGVVSVVRSAYREPALDIPRYPNVVQTDAAINPGNSGGPLLDLGGRLIGVNSAGRTLSPGGRIVQGQNYAIGVDRVKEVAATLREGRSIGWTGLSFDYATPQELRRKGLPPGLLVGAAVEGTAAARAGIRAGSLIVGVGGKPVDNSLASYCDAVQGLDSGASASFEVLDPGASAARDVQLTFE